MNPGSDGAVHVTTEGVVATIWLDRPDKRNAMSYTMWSDLERAATMLGTDASVRVVVVRGRGGHFCAGADITDLHRGRPDGERSFAEVNLAAEQALASLPKPTVAFVEGDCIGGGCAIAIDCDLRLATIGARFGITPAKLGIVYPAASLERAVRVLGPATAKRLLFTAELIDAPEAARLDLVHQVVDAVDAEEQLATLTGVLADRSLLTQSATKAMVEEVLVSGHVPSDVQRHWSNVAGSSAEAAEGLAAFRDRRPARFEWSGLDGI